MINRVPKAEPMSGEITRNRPVSTGPGAVQSYRCVPAIEHRQHKNTVRHIVEHASTDITCNASLADRHCGRFSGNARRVLGHVSILRRAIGNLRRGGRQRQLRSGLRGLLQSMARPGVWSRRRSGGPCDTRRRIGMMICCRRRSPWPLYAAVASAAFVGARTGV